MGKTINEYFTKKGLLMIGFTMTNTTCDEKSENVTFLKVSFKKDLFTKNGFQGGDLLEFNANLVAIEKVKGDKTFINYFVEKFNSPITILEHGSSLEVNDESGK